MKSEQQDQKKKLVTLESEDDTKKIVHRFILATRNPGIKNYTQRFNEPHASYHLCETGSHL